MHQNEELRRISRLGQLVIVLAFGGAAFWLALAPLHGAVVATGLVRVESYKKTVQHWEGGIVKDILVRDGQQVQEGQPLVVLEDSQAAAAYSVLRSALDSDLARKARLEAEATGSPKLLFAPELLERKAKPAVSELMDREYRLFQAKAETLRKQVILLEKQISQSEKEYEALSDQMQAERSSEVLAREELDSYQALRDKNFISTPRLLEQKRKVLDYKSRSEERRAEIARALRQKEELRLKILSLRSEYVQGAVAELKETTSRIVELSDRIRPSADALARQTITAPVSGTILGLRVHTQGSSIAPREPILDVVPNDRALVIEAQVSVNAIKELYVGQSADIRFPALPYRTTPLVAGQVVYVAADVQFDKNGVPYYLIHIALDPESLRSAQVTQLQPGMAAEIYVRTQSRTAFEYLLKPITDTLARSFREK